MDGAKVALDEVGWTALRHVQSIYYDGPHYDQRYASYTRDVDFWCDLARTNGGPMLELAAGTGRLSLPIAALGLDVVGMDVAPSMVSQAVRKRGTSPGPLFLERDMRDFDLDRRFRLVMLACSSVCHLLSDDDALRCFSAVARHVTRDGVFAIDVATPEHETARADGKWHDRFAYADPGTGQPVTVRGQRTYDPATRLLVDRMEYTFAENGGTEHATRTSRMYSFDDLTGLLAAAGFEVTQAFGDFDRRPLATDSPTQILVCAKTGT